MPRSIDFRRVPHPAARRGISTRWVPLFTVLGFLVLSESAVAQVFYDNLGNADVFEDDDIVSFIGDYASLGDTEDWFQGFRFTSGASGPVASIDVAVGNYLDGPGTMEFRLYADAAGGLGALLGTFTVTATAEQFDGSIKRGRVDEGSGGPTLAQGSDYWLMATAATPTIWFRNEQGDVLPRLWTPDGVGGTLNADTLAAAAFRVNGPPPVPLMGPTATVLLAGLGGAMGLRALRRTHPSRRGTTCARTSRR
ncbi:MAG: hypothetical protein NXI30_01835 [bacterium]|nr:hypothetical protein [bacterium]